MNKSVRIFRYVTEGTFDAYSWQVIENKQKFISQIMTSRSPVRSCEDVDEAALSYAEVKALATGNPYIKEKMALDVEVSKLKLLKADYTSRKYHLENNITNRYPLQAASLKACISGLEADIRTVRENLPWLGTEATEREKAQFHMQVGNKTYTDRKEAGAAIIGMCRETKGMNAGVTIGEYAGFKMTVSVDPFYHKTEMELKGQISHKLEIGADPLGNIARINHVLENVEKNLAEAREKKAEVERQLETAKRELGKPFEKEKELSEKLARLAELNSLLDMEGGNGKTGGPVREDTMEKGKEATGHAGMQCRSVIGRLRQLQPDTETVCGRDTGKNRDDQQHDAGY